RRWRRRRRGRRRRRRGRWRRRRRRGSSRRRRRRCAAGTLAVVRCFSPRCPVWGGPAGAALGCPRGPAPRQSRLERGGQGGPGQARQPRAAKKKKLTAEGLPQCVWPCGSPGGPGTGGAGPAARARCGASAGVRSSLGGCTEKHPLCPDGRRPGRDIGSGAASRRPTAWWGPRRRQRWPYSVLTSSPPDLQAKQGCPENPDRRGDSGDREGAAQTARAARELSRAERGDPAKQRQASPVGSRLGSQPAGKGSGPSWSGDRLESLCGPQH
ncbi:unnamed protein product, partial [Prorocentrum cordatum]